MRAIAILDDTTQIGGEVITYEEQQEMSVSEEPEKEDETEVEEVSEQPEPVSIDEEVYGPPKDLMTPKEEGTPTIPEQSELEVPAVSVDIAQAEDLVSFEKVNEMVNEAFEGAIDITTSQNELDIAKSSIPWAFETAENISRIIEGFPDLSFLETYLEGREEAQMSSHPDRTVFPYQEKESNYLSGDLNMIIGIRESMGKILLEAKEKGNLTKEDAWRLYNVTDASIVAEGDIISGLQRIPSDPWLSAVMGAGKNNPFGVPVFSVNEEWSQRATELVGEATKEIEGLTEDVKMLEELRSDLLEMYPEFGGG